MSTKTIWRVSAAVALVALALVGGALVGGALVGGGSALAAPAPAPTMQEDGVVPGMYVSEPITADDGTTFDISVILLEDGSASMVRSTDELTDSAVGAWGASDDGTVTVTLTESEGQELDAPVVTVFEAADDVLTAVEYDETIFGEDGFSATLSVTEEEMNAAEEEGLAGENAPSGSTVSGVYSTDIVDLGAPSVWIVNFNDDGTFQFGAMIFDGETDVSSITGTWEADENGKITLTAENELYATKDGETEVSESDQEEPLVLTLDADGTLVADEDSTGGPPLVFYPHHPSAAMAAGEQAAIAQNTLLFVSDILPAADTPGRVISLALAEDGGAAMATNYLNDEPAFVEDGYWVKNDDGTLTVTLTGSDGQEYDEPTEITFELADDTLTAVDYDENLYGEAGLVLTLVPAASEAAPDPLDAPSGGGAAGGDAEAAAPAAIEGAAESAANDSEMVPSSFAEAFSMDEGIDAGRLVFQSDVLPAADTPGRQITLTLSMEGAAEMSTDYMNDEPPIVEIGEWTDNGDDTLTVTLTGREDRAYDEPTEIVFEVEDDTLTAVEYDKTLYGSEGLTLTLVTE